MYYVIHNSEGDTFVEALDEGTLKERLAEKYYGNGGFLDGQDIDLRSDTNYWDTNILIIKGTIVQPKAIEVVTQYEL